VAEEKWRGKISLVVFNYKCLRGARIDLKQGENIF